MARTLRQDPHSQPRIEGALWYGDDLNCCVGEGVGLNLVKTSSDLTPVPSVARRSQAARVEKRLVQVEDQCVDLHSNKLTAPTGRNSLSGAEEELDALPPPAGLRSTISSVQGYVGGRRGMAREMKPEDVVLLIAAGADGPYGFDPIRLMKGVFLVSQRGPEEWQGWFDFSPYSYGPFDSGVYVLRDRLLRDGLLAAEQQGRYAKYSLTEAGRRRVDYLKGEVPEKTVEWLGSIGSYVTSKSFARLLREIYATFPEYATRSVLR